MIQVLKYFKAFKNYMLLYPALLHTPIFSLNEPESTGKGRGKTIINNVTNYLTFTAMT